MAGVDFSTSLAILALIVLIFILAVFLSFSVLMMIAEERAKAKATRRLSGSRFRSEFLCRNCGKTFVLVGERRSVPFCPECGAPEPKHIVTLEIRG